MAGGKRVPAALVKSLAAVVLLAGLGGGAYWWDQADEAALRDEYVAAVAADAETSPAVKIAMVMGRYYESSNKHIGKPYVDNLGKGRPLTVCAGITGKGVVAGRWYTPAQCYALERGRYLEAEKDAARRLVYWAKYDPFAQASFIDFIFNVGVGNFSTSTMLRKANAGDLEGACRENPRWNKGTVGGVLTVLPGLVSRRGSNDEICREWRLLEGTP